MKVAPVYRIASVTINAFVGSVFVVDDLFICDDSGLRMTFGAGHIGMTTSQG
jgi:hypothetical protein